MEAASTLVYTALGILGVCAVYWYEKFTARKAKRRREAMKRVIRRSRRAEAEAQNIQQGRA